MNPKIKYTLFTVIIMSALLRGLLAGFLELGNDEVYYWTYALFPAWSHFDHPPMVGFMIQVFTLDLWLDHEFFLRLSSVLFGIVNTWLIFLIGSRIRDQFTGLYAAILYNASIYCFVIAGVFILPDTPQLMFWLLSLYLLVDILSVNSPTKRQQTKMILAGLVIGLGMLSKYTSVFLWVGIMGYIILYNRNWFRYKALYLSLFISIIVFLPVLIWNFQNDFISFTFQGERVDVSKSGIQIDSFLRELVGQIFYNNPVTIVWIVLALLALCRKKRFLTVEHQRFLLWISFPLILIFLAFSLFRGTLPHWSGPGYLGLILITSAYLASRYEHKITRFPWQIQISVYFLLLVLVLGFAQIKFGYILKPDTSQNKHLGKHDFSLDMYGWKQLGGKFSTIYKNDLDQGICDTNWVMVSYRWFPAAHFDYYVAGPLNINMMALGNLERIHKYAWINEERGGFYEGMNAYYVTRSHDYKDPYPYWSPYFEGIIPSDTIHIMRRGKTVDYAYVYRLCHMKALPDMAR